MVDPAPPSANSTPAAQGDGGKKLLYLIDTYSLVFQNFHGIPAMTGPKGQPTNAVFGFTRDLRALLDKKPSHLVMCMEGGKTERSEQFADYKATRKETPPDLETQVPLILEMAAGHGVPCVSFPGQEADDVMATLAVKGAAEGFEVRIVTTDKDARQVVSEKIRLYNCRSGKTLGPEELMEEWGVRPDQVTDFQGLVGDSSDNIPGVPKVGPKAATELLTRYGTLEGVLKAAEPGPDAIEKSRVLNKTVRANLADPEHRKNAVLSKRLATLRTDLELPMTWEDAAISPPDHDRLLKLYTELGFKRLSEEARDNSENVPTQVVGAGGYVRRKRGEQDDGAKLKAITIATPEAFDDFLDELREQPEFCVDLETTSTDASRADIVGWAVCWQDHRAYYIPVQSPEGAPALDPVAVLEGMRPILADPNKTVHNQNLKYDLTVLLRAGADIATVGVDPMVGDYLLAAGERSHSLDALARRHLDRRTTPITDLIGKGKNQKLMFEVEVEDVTAYAAEDADVAWQLAGLMREKLEAEHLWELYETVERPLIPVLARMEHVGIALDVPELERQSAEITERLNALEAEIQDLAGREFNVRSNKQLQEILFDELGLPVVKRTKTGPSTDAEVLEKLAPKHPLPAKVQEYRGLTKLQGTYVDALPKLVHPETGRIHCSFNQVVTSTGRLSSSDPNLQNIPVRTPEGRRVRQAFVPGEAGWKLLAADYSQIELRFLAHYSGDQALVDAFNEDRDVHTAVAAEIFGVPLDEVTSDQRRIAKTTNFGVIYGQSSYGLSSTLGIPQDEAQAFIDAYLETYPGVRKLIEKTLSNVRNSGYAYTILGRRREVTGIRPRYQGQMNLAERTAFNAVIQGSAADLIKLAMIAVDDRLRRENRPARLLLQIHDELLFETPPDFVDDLSGLVTEEMTNAMSLDVPLRVDVNVGENWLDAK
ncbi:DNA polymerase I [Alienimonas sp. DA493]|uniref:DNA polymerase I n=1 Tax=Alienimonas sp. DA493 TaxID=3373605 RepID=UPI003754A3D0